ncbi:hypothetical protein TNCV_4768351 [Trichonephila clavipes]|nr:hypothetical protein TNCV_4768351 [Trichonephila clavipes]
MTWSVAESPRVAEQCDVHIHSLEVLFLHDSLESRSRDRHVAVSRPQCPSILSYSRAFGDGPRNFEPWSSDVDDT